MLENKESNIAFIDGQNLHFGTRESGWTIDHAKFRIYLSEKYKVTEAYYFLGFKSESEEKLYENLTKAGFIIVFKEHNLALRGIKKGNVDTDIVFEVMKNLIDNELFDKVLLVSGDGDYIKLVKYLIGKDKFIKILFPNKNFASSLYNFLGDSFFSYLEDSDIKEKISYHK